MDNNQKNAIYNFIVGKLQVTNPIAAHDAKGVLFFYLDNSGTIDVTQSQITQLTQAIALEQGQVASLQTDIINKQAQLDALKKPPPPPPPVNP